MNTAERAALEHENWIAYLTNVVRCADSGRVHREGGTVTILSDIPFDWFNQVLIERPDATPRARAPRNQHRGAQVRAVAFEVDVGPVALEVRGPVGPR